MLLLKGFHSIVLLLYYRLWWPYLSKRNGKNNRIAERIALLDLASGIISIITPLTILNNNIIVTNRAKSFLKLLNKVPIFWEGHKKLPHLLLIIWRYKIMSKEEWKMGQTFTVFSENLNFMESEILLKND